MRRNSKDWSTACHEAGHALAYYWLCKRIRHVSIVPDGQSLGRVIGWKIQKASAMFMETVERELFYDPASSARIARWLDNVVSLLAGGEAERLLAPKTPHRAIRAGMRSDLQKVSDILFTLFPDNEARLVFKWLQTRARNLVGHRRHRIMIRDLAKALMVKREMSGNEALVVLRESFDRQTP
jgi:hypothetical protein